MNALLIFLFCFISGGSCQFVESARVTTYAPELSGINCQEPCNLTGYLLPLEYGVGAACGLSIPYNTRVYIEGVGWRVCNDHGGAIDDDEVDILIQAEEYPSWMAGMRDTVWVFP